MDFPLFAYIKEVCYSRLFPFPYFSVNLFPRILYSFTRQKSFLFILPGSKTKYIFFKQKVSIHE